MQDSSNFKFPRPKLTDSLRPSVDSLDYRVPVHRAEQGSGFQPLAVSGSLLK
jgi:hypothetical protein